MSRKLGLLAAAVIAVGLAGTSLPAAANVQTICPGTSYTASPGTTAQINCNLIITFGPNGAITTSVPAGATSNYDGTEDALIGVINNSGAWLFSFAINGTNIFGFDGDGIVTYTGVGPVAGNPDTSGYGGPDAWFANINFALSSGIVNFLNGIPDGGTNYFSLEESISLNQLPTIRAVPEPASLSLFAVGLLGLALLRRRQQT